MFGGELIDGHSVDEPVERAHHRGAFPCGMIGRTVQRVSEEQLRTLRLRDHLIQLCDLLANRSTPLRARRVEDSSRGVQR